MTARAAFVIAGGAGEEVYYAGRNNTRAAFLATFPGNAMDSDATYKNAGWYSAGSTWEVWLSSGNPSTTPPSGHTLTYLHHVVVA